MDEPTASRLLIFLIPLGIILIFGGMVFFLARNAKRNKIRSLELAATLGFQPVAEMDHPRLLRRLAQINPKHGGKDKELRNVFIKHLPDGDLYLYDLWDTGGDSSSVVEDKALAMVYSGRQFPRFAISARINMPGVLAKLANNVISWAITRNLIVIQFPENPTFNERFIVACEDEQETRTLLDASIINRLARFDGLFLAGAGDTLEFCP